MEFLATLIGLVCFFLPTIIAFWRGHASKWAIFAVNFFFGWTVIGWWIALIKALGNKGSSVQVSVNVNNVQNNGGTQ